MDVVRNFLFNLVSFLYSVFTVITECIGSMLLLEALDSLLDIEASADDGVSCFNCMALQFFNVISLSSYEGSAYFVATINVLP